MLMALGNFIFELRTAAFSSMKKSYEYRWASTDVIGNSPILQAIGKGSDKVDLDGVLYPMLYESGIDIASKIILGKPLDALKNIAAEQKPVLMVDGTGGIHGLWVIKQIEETQSFFDKFGNPKKVEFSINLEKYGGEDMGLLDILRKIL